MLVAVVEHLDALLRLTYQSAAGKRAPWKPLRIPRAVAEEDGVAVVSTGRREATPDELLALLGAGGKSYGG